MSLIILCFLGAVHLKGQDTICKLSGGCFVADIHSQNKSEINYKLPEYKNDFLQSIPKDGFSGPRFRSKMLDVYPAGRCVPADTNKIYQVSKGYVYKNENISNKEMLGLIKALPCIEKQKEMLPLHKKLRRNHRNRTIFALSGIAMVPFGAFPVLILRSLGDSESTAPIALTYFGIGSTLVGISQVCNFNYHRKKKRLVKMYNTF